MKHIHIPIFVCYKVGTGDSGSSEWEPMLKHAAGVMGAIVEAGEYHGCLHQAVVRNR